jgi:hypothetical protein
MTQLDRIRESLPSLAEISLAWEWLGADVLKDVFPGLRCFEIGWGEPFCFRCGWLAPGPEAADYPASWKAERAIGSAWDAASGWLERAHLQDHNEGGDTDAWNLVPLCPLCHEDQPLCRTRDEGIAFVNTRSRYAGLVWAAQIFTDAHYRDRRRPGKGMALRCLLRAYAFTGAVAADATLKGAA